ncbi:hypothetical protein [Pseudonocardia xinjiangensis]|uniref:Uncharacterized protein n=1 Tax=Pseudonocardia xinjiangensis TaxID=75289 RepID=A0ABX1RCU0_9PSEU|nr:hypothetical protein [Pseudonocardia xinjiangensis]NMH76940.1 hypothetical protein [Pseudonocardia xinjiangensis]
MTPGPGDAPFDRDGSPPFRAPSDEADRREEASSPSGTVPPGRPAGPSRPPAWPGRPEARPPVVEEIAVLGFSRHLRSRIGTRLFTWFFVLVFALILVQLVASLLHP